MNANTLARLARMAQEANTQAAILAARKAQYNNQKKNAAAILAARKDQYNKRVANAAAMRKSANENRNRKLQEARARARHIVRIRAMPNDQVAKFFTTFRNNNGHLMPRRRVAEELFGRFNNNKGIAQAYLNRFNKWNLGHSSIAARARGLGQGSVRGTQIKQALGKFFTTGPRLARLTAFRPFARRANIVSRARNM